MLTSRQLYTRINEIVERSYLGFFFMLLGEDVLSDDQKRKVESLGLIIGRRPLIELLYILIRNRPTEGYAKDATLNTLLDQVASTGVLPILNDAQQATLDVGKAAIMEAVESTKDLVKKQLRQEIVEANREYRQHVAVKRVENVPQVKQRENALKKRLLKLVPAIMVSAQEAFGRSFASALTDTVNDAAVDSATSDSLITGVPPKDIIVYKITVDDASRCTWCRKFYVNEDGSPKIYRLEDLQANGTNYGRPKSEWLPTVGKTHVRCRCMLFHAR